MKKLLFVLLVAVVASIAFAQVQYPVLAFPPVWTWGNPGPVATETEIELEILPQVGIRTHRTVDLGPICLMDDVGKTWTFPFWTKSNCNVLVKLHWYFTSLEATCTNENFVFDDVVAEIKKALKLNYLGYYEYDWLDERYEGIGGIPEGNLPDPQIMFCPWDPNAFYFGVWQNVVNPIPMEICEDYYFVLKSCQRKHFLEFAWGREWDACESDWCLTLPAGKYYFLLTYDLGFACPDVPPLFGFKPIPPIG